MAIEVGQKMWVLVTGQTVFVRELLEDGLVQVEVRPGVTSPVPAAGLTADYAAALAAARHRAIFGGR